MAEAQTRNVLITGATGGLGEAIALACAARGAQVVLLDRRQRPLERLCDRIEASGGLAPGYVDVDLAAVGPEELSDLVQRLSEAYGAMDVVVHAAARFDGLRPLDQVAPPDWLLDLQVNLNVAWLLSVSCLPGLRERRGKLVFFDDEDARQSAYWGGYGVAKGALQSLARLFSEELEDSGCEVVHFDPGPLRTDLRAAAYLAEDPNTVPEPTAVADALAERLLPNASTP